MEEMACWNREKSLLFGKKQEGDKKRLEILRKCRMIFHILVYICG